MTTFDPSCVSFPSASLLTPLNTSSENEQTKICSYARCWTRRGRNIKYQRLRLKSHHVKIFYTHLRVRKSPIKRMKTFRCLEIGQYTGKLGLLSAADEDTSVGLKNSSNSLQSYIKDPLWKQWELGTSEARVFSKCDFFFVSLSFTVNCQLHWGIILSSSSLMKLNEKLIFFWLTSLMFVKETWCRSEQITCQFKLRCQCGGLSVRKYEGSSVKETHWSDNHKTS